MTDGREHTTPPVAMTIAGSDSGGGAGIQADLRSFAALGVFGTSVITATTAQNTTAVTDVHVLPADHVAAQLDAVLDDFPVAAVKTGMLATAELVGLVGERAAAGDLPGLVVDPVLVASSGARLLEDEAVATYRELLLPHAAVVTPNLIEAGVLVGRELGGLDEVVSAAEELVGLGAQVAVVKGGHAEGPYATDVVVTRDGARWELEARRISSDNNHGTGCTFGAATAAGLASGLLVRDALEQAKRYVTASMAAGAGWGLGAGHGPLDHFGFGATALPPFSATGWTRATGSRSTERPKAPPRGDAL